MQTESKKFNVGDTVVVDSYALEFAKETRQSPGVVESMFYLVGRECTISKVVGEWVEIKEDPYDFWWNPEWLVHADTPELEAGIFDDMF